MKQLLVLAIFLVLFVPLISNAQYGAKYTSQPEGFVLCGNPNQPPCDFSYFVLTLNKIIEWIISIAGVIFTLTLAYGGYLYMTSGGDSGKREQAHSILWNTLKGFVIILVAWLIVYTIINTLVDSGQKGSILRFLK